ncbi:hypothetical protein H1P_6340004 [Hyella patelloides LEGE 07179]|uniref:Uncharacterized protein n=1 Tax=Hyella patelloides LEGE 07179 TaxID=945734 RepID=A0A563W210_9CYAN|nr:hypothetical protein H1P_6340004 [Hyella patelloides LEGE 07179]
MKQYDDPRIGLWRNYNKRLFNIVLFLALYGGSLWIPGTYCGEGS